MSSARTPHAEATADHHAHGGPTGLPPRRIAALVACALVVIQAGMLVLFAWPNARLHPRDVPISVTGPAPAVAGVVEGLRRADPGAFDVHVADDEAAARERILDRKDYGALVIGPDGPRVLVASGASVPVAQLLEQVAAGVNGGRPVPVDDLVPPASGDPRGTGLNSGMLPLVLTGMFSGILLTLLVSQVRWRVAAAAVFSLVGGVCATGLIQGWVGVIRGPFLLNAAVLAAMMFAIGTTIIGLAAVFGRPGMALGAVLMFLVGNPSGVAAGPQMLPQPWGTLGQFLPPGAGGSLLRSTAFFDGHGAARPLAVLLGWMVLAAGLVAVGALRNRRIRPAASS
ncbi:ABC transporter permease [Streptomycetaceae bacterium NBC_01309]